MLNTNQSSGLVFGEEAGPDSAGPASHDSDTGATLAVAGHAENDEN